MSKKEDIHVVPNTNGWVVEKENHSKHIKITQTQKEAIEIAEKLAKKDHVDTKIHGRNGRIRGGNSYGNDPYPPKDKK